MITLKKLLLLVSFLLLLLLPASSWADAPAPGWRVAAPSYPTVLAPGGSGFVEVEVFNIGAAPSVAGATLTAVLPANIVASSGKGWECLGSSPQVCTLSVPSIAPGAQESVEGTGLEGKEHRLSDYPLPVLARSGAGALGPEVVGVTVAGGGAPAPASTSDALAVSATPPGFGIAGWTGWFSNANGTLDTQAGSHPYEAAFALALTANGEQHPAGGELRSSTVSLPPGLVANPDAAPQCTREQFYGADGGSVCPASSQIGEGVVKLGEVTGQFPIYNLVPPPGLPSQFGFTVEGISAFIDGSVRSGSDYGLDGDIEDVAQEHNVIHADVTLWGDPAEAGHDPQRCTLFIEPGHSEPVKRCDLSSDAQGEPFLTLPTACGTELSTGMAVRDWQSPDAPPREASFKTPAITGCQRLAFAPKISAAPDTTYADTPAGLSVEVHVPQEGLATAAGVSEADIENTTVALPAGVDINPGQAAGLAACGQPESALGTENAPSCPNASKVGEVRIKTPLLEGAAEKELTGDVYVMNSNPPHLQLLVAASGDGVNIKLVGDVSLCENTGEVIAGPGPVADRTCAAPGQLITKFTETPELPFTNFKLTFSGGAQAALATPTQCGVYTSTADFESWANPFIEEAFPVSRFQVSSGPDGGACSPNPLPFSPELIAGATNPQGGAFTNFSLLLARGDGQQRIEKLQFKAPAGLSGVLSSVPLCQEPQAQAGTCSAASRIGHAVVDSGPGPYPLVLPQPGDPEFPIYLTGPYDGAPFGLSIVSPIVAGPFNLGTIVTRAKIEIDPHTAQITVTTEPLPQVVDGVPTDLRLIDSVIERPGFMINPTHCAPASFAGTAYGTPPAGQAGPHAEAAISSSFDLVGCAGLKFEPKFDVSTSAQDNFNDLGADLVAKVSYPNVPQGTEADIARFKVELPLALPSRLTTLQKACTDKQFEANPAGCPSASMIGHAVVHTPLIPVPLEGPAIFVSHGGEAFPSLTMVLQGDGVTIDLVGTTYISHAGITSTTFKTVPDQPFYSFELTLPKGKYSALASNTNVCKPVKTETVKKKVSVKRHGKTVKVTKKVEEQVAAPLEMPTEIVGQNGAEVHEQTKISVEGCPRAKPAKKASKHHKRGKVGHR
jgi:hypothetical protein